MKEKDNIMVSIDCLAYNQAPYIRQALDSFLMQKTDFQFEILIHDDASTDGTADIIKEYEEKYPEVVKPIYQKENMWSKVMAMSAEYQFPRARGKYIAICEGDDFWLDSLKLQKQVDFLENNQQYSAVAGIASHRNNNDGKELFKSPKSFCRGHELDVKQFLSGKYFATNTLTFRNYFFDNYDKEKIKKLCHKSRVADILITLFLYDKGKIFILNDLLSVARVRHDPGEFNYNSIRNNEEQIDDLLIVLNNVKETYKGKFDLSYYCYSGFSVSILRAFASGRVNEIREIIRKIPSYYQKNKYFGLIKCGFTQVIKKMQRVLFKKFGV